MKSKQAITTEQAQEQMALKYTKEEIERLEAENSILRELLWIRHGCEISGLYGDDGEQQCGRCLIDFKRDSATKILYTFERLGITAAEKAVRESEYVDTN